jgi:hypothetical protein
MDFNIWIAIAVFLFYLLIDVLYVLYTRYIVEHRPLACANVAGLIYGLVALGTVSYTNNKWYIIPVVAGSWLGTYIAAKYLNKEVDPKTK